MNHELQLTTTVRVRSNRRISEREVEQNALLVKIALEEAGFEIVDEPIPNLIDDVQAATKGEACNSTS